MAHELAKMRSIRIGQREMRISLNNREEANKKLRQQITPIWTAEKDKRTAELEKYTKALVEGREKVREYQKSLREFKHQIKETNREYDLANKD